MRPALLLSLLLALAPAARAAGAGAEPFNFLFLDADARPVGMGGAYTALVGDANSLLYNPAGLARVVGHEASFMHNQHFREITQEYAAYASRWGFGANLNALRFGKTGRTTYSNPGGGGLSSVDMNSLALGAGYGREVTPGLRAGAGVKLIRESIAGVTAQGYALDLGVQHDVAFLPGLALGAAVQNIGPAVRYQRDSEKLPMNTRFGGAYAFRLLGAAHTAALDVSKTRSESPVVAAGLETLAAGVLPVRFGFNTRNDAGPGVTAGIGWRGESFGLDYAFVPYGELGMGHRFSVTVRWGQEVEREDDAETRSRQAERRRDNPNTRFASANRLLASGQVSAARRELDLGKALLAPGDRRIVLYYQKSGEASLLEAETDEAREYFLTAIREARRIGTTGPAVAG
ncbi:MAG: hypothetical protein FD126_265, partial [Elusimicrobia bacterium]